MKLTPDVSPAVKPVTSRDNKAVIVELEDEASSATALEMADKVEPDDIFELMSVTMTALSAPGVRSIVMVNETTPLLSMPVMATSAPSGKAPSA